MPGCRSLVARLDRRGQLAAARCRAASSSGWRSPAPCWRKPDWLFLDEATASLDPESEAELYRVLKQRLPHTTIVSIAHRPAVAAFHDQRMVFRREEGRPGTLVTVPAEAEAVAGG